MKNAALIYIHFLFLWGVSIILAINFLNSDGLTSDQEIFSSSGQFKVKVKVKAKIKNQSQLLKDNNDEYAYQDFNQEYFDFSYVKWAFRDFSIFNEQKISKGQFEAMLIETVPFNLQANFKKYMRLTLSLSEKYQIDPFWVLAIMWTESHYNPTSVSPVGALGPMQIMPVTGQHLNDHLMKNYKVGFHHNYFVSLSYYQNLKRNQAPYRKILIPKMNIEMGIIYLKYLSKIFHHNSRYATISYNMGPNRVKQMLKDNIPVGETNRYLDKVVRNYQTLSSPFQSKK